MLLRDLFDELPLSNSDVIPIALQKLLREPLDVYADWKRTEQLLLDAKTMLPGKLEVSMALYKMYAYSNQFEKAIATINEVLAEAAAQGGFPDNWRTLNTDSANWDNASGVIRAYLYTLKASGFVCLRQGNIALAIEVLEKLRELDPLDQVGGSMIYEIAERLLETEEKQSQHV